MLRIIVHLTSGGCISFHVNYEEEEEKEEKKKKKKKRKKKKKKRVCGLYFVPLYAVILRAFAEKMSTLARFTTCAPAGMTLVRKLPQA